MNEEEIKKEIKKIIDSYFQRDEKSTLRVDSEGIGNVRLALRDQDEKGESFFDMLVFDMDNEKNETLKKKKIVRCIVLLGEYGLKPTNTVLKILIASLTQFFDGQLQLDGFIKLSRFIFGFYSPHPAIQEKLKNYFSEYLQNVEKNEALNTLENNMVNLSRFSISLYYVDRNKLSFGEETTPESINNILCTDISGGIYEISDIKSIDSKKLTTFKHENFDFEYFNEYIKQRKEFEKNIKG